MGTCGSGRHGTISYLSSPGAQTLGSGMVSMSSTRKIMASTPPLSRLADRSTVARRNQKRFRNILLASAGGWHLMAVSVVRRLRPSAHHASCTGWNRFTTSMARARLSASLTMGLSSFSDSPSPKALPMADSQRTSSTVVGDAGPRSGALLNASRACFTGVVRSPVYASAASCSRRMRPRRS